MGNDKAFAVFAVSLVAGVCTLIAIAVLAGIAAVPGPMAFVEHLGIAFLIRAAYKGFGGFNWSDWSVVSSGSLETAATEIEVGAKA